VSSSRAEDSAIGPDWAAWARFSAVSMVFCDTCKTRYRMADAPCELRYLDDETVELVFDEPQWAVTPGQSAVLYDGDVCLGGGIIMSTDKPVIITR
ncbi:MAG: aminomethyltransferase beta-barrel domain-containing protein, partial [Neisseria elongata]